MDDAEHSKSDGTDGPPTGPGGLWQHPVPPLSYQASPLGYWMPAPRPGTSFPRAYAAAAVWYAPIAPLALMAGLEDPHTLHSLLPILMIGFSIMICAGALLVWWTTHSRPCKFWQLVLIALPMDVIALVALEFFRQPTPGTY